MKIFCAILFFSSFVSAQELNDYGTLLNQESFSNHCNIKYSDLNMNIYSHSSCDSVEKLFIETYIHIKDFLQKNNYKLIIDKNITIRIITLAEMNNPNRFSLTDKKCMYDVNCNSGAYFGRTFYTELSSNINIYVVFTNLISNKSKYGFGNTFKHELMHALLSSSNCFFNMKQQHAFIDSFLKYEIKNKNGI